MERNPRERFPPLFGSTPDDFLKRFGRLIYSIIQRKCKEERVIISPEGKYIKVRLEPENIFNGFIAHIAKNDYKVLENYKGIHGAAPQTYLVKVLNWFIFAELKREQKRRMREINDEDAVSGAQAKDDPASNLIRKEREQTFNQAVEAATAKFKKDKDKLIVDLFYVEGMKAKDIATLFRIKEKAVYKITEKFRKYLNEESKKRGIFEFE